MRRLLLIVCLLLVGARAEATPFTPDHFRLIINGTQPYTYCLQCDDANLSNDLHLSVSLQGGLGSFQFLFNDIVAGSGTATSDGVAPDSNYVIPFDFSATLELWDSAAPDLRSFTNGVLSGSLWVTQFDHLFVCCTGSINTVPIYSPFRYAPLFPPETAGVVLLVARPNNPVFMPAEVPEPGSLLLLGTGLIALRRRKRQIVWSPAGIGDIEPCAQERL